MITRSRKAWAVWVVAHNWRVQKRCPRITALALKLGHIRMIGDPDTVKALPENTFTLPDKAFDKFTETLEENPIKSNATLAEFLNRPKRWSSS